jgi:hypothetical protein
VTVIFSCAALKSLQATHGPRMIPEGDVFMRLMQHLGHAEEIFKSLPREPPAERPEEGGA